MMFTLKVLGTRRSVLAFHHCDTVAEVDELLAVYRALGYADAMLLVEEKAQAQAA